MFACIYVPDFPVEAMVRPHPWLRERAVVALEGKPPLVRVIALNQKARHLGMEAGMTKLQASMFAGASPTAAVLRPRSPEQETSAHAALLDVAHAFTPRVEDTASDTLLLELAGLERLYGAPATMAHDLAARVHAVGLEANLALAANPDAAMHVARGFNGITVIPAGDEPQRLAALPVQLLLDAFEFSSAKIAIGTPEREELLETLKRWGIRDFRALALLPEPALASRLGGVGVTLQLLARGVSSRTLALCEPPAQFVEAMELESPVEILEPLSFLLNRLLEQLCARLEARSLAVQELQLRLQLERRVADEETTTIEELTGLVASSHNVGVKPVYARTLRLPVSMRDSKVFLKLLQLDLAAHPPGAPITKIWIKAEPAPPRSAQRGLFLPVTPEAEKLEITLARIDGIVGKRRAGIVRLLDRHRSDSFQVDRFVAPSATSTTTKWDKDFYSISTLSLSDIENQQFLALRILRPAWRLQVHLSNGRPVTLLAEGSGRAKLIRGNVLWSAGPWRSSGDWWTENREEERTGQNNSGPWEREEWDIALFARHSKTMANENGASAADSNGNALALYRIFRDRLTGHWFADASYD
jgi:protein ImuB